MPTASIRVKLQEAVRALRHRNFRLFVIGQGISVTGTWMQRVAESWLAYRLTHSAWILALVFFAGRAPNLLGPLGGVVADRMSRHRLLLWTQSLSMVQAIALGWLTLRGEITPGRLIAFALVLGLINAADSPGRQSFFVEMVGHDDLPSAIALNSSLVNTARVLGPVLAGLIVALVGEGVCFLVNGASFLAVIVCLLAMRLSKPRPHPHPEEGSYLRQGLAAAWHAPSLREPLLLLAAVSFSGMPYSALLPIFAGSIFHGGAALLGGLMAASAVGGVVGSFWLASRGSTVELSRNLAVAPFAAALGLVLLAGSHQLALAVLAMPVIGWGMMASLAGVNTMIQSYVPDHLRGRVMGLFSMTFLGIGPFGTLLAGWIARRMGAPLTIFLGAIGCALAGVRFASQLTRLREHLAAVHLRPEPDSVLRT
jgi:MFS family permease